MAKTPERRLRAPGPALEAGAGAGRRGGRRHAGDDRRRRRRLQARAVGLALLRREGQEGEATTSTRRRSGPTSRSTRCARAPSALASKLWGITFASATDIPIYNPEVQASRSRRRTARTSASSYMDFHPRPGKRGGAWCNNSATSGSSDGDGVPPIVYNVCNFSRPTGDTPALLTLDEVGDALPRVRPRPARPVLEVPLPRLAGTDVAQRLRRAADARSWRTG